MKHCLEIKQTTKVNISTSLPKGENKSALPSRGHGFGPGMSLNVLTEQ